MRWMTLGWVAAAMTVACGETTRTDDVLALAGDEAAGATVYTESCATCHGADGMGGTGPSLVDYMPGSDDAETVDLILNGGGGMPGFASSLEDQDIADVLEYMHSEFGG